MNRRQSVFDGPFFNGGKGAVSNDLDLFPLFKPIAVEFKFEGSFHWEYEICGLSLYCVNHPAKSYHIDNRSICKI
jgi:hypothetical protein